MSENKIQIVFNPFSAGGKTGKNKPRILGELFRQLGNCFDLSETSKNSDATKITREAIANSYDVIVAVGGDGTINQVVNGFFKDGIIINPKVKLGIVSLGTGQGFAQSIGLPKDLSSQIQVMKNQYTSLIDLGKINFEKNNKQRYFINEFQLGIGGTLNKSISPVTKKIFGKLAFGFEAVKTLFHYQANEIELSIDKKIFKEKFIGVSISNGKYTGGGMRLTPFADPVDGLLDVLIIKDMSITDRLLSFSKVYSANHIYCEAFQLFKTNKVEFKYENGLAASADGELINEKCVSAEIIPSALKVITNN